MQPVAIGRKSLSRETPPIKRKPLQSVATRCRNERMVRNAMKKASRGVMLRASS
jgi:hypothetical protein